MFKQIELPTLEEFQKLCENHDWTFGYSDDHRVYTRGRDQRDFLLRCITNGGDDYLNIYTDEAARHPYG